MNVDVNGYSFISFVKINIICKGYCRCGKVKAFRYLEGSAVAIATSDGYISSNGFVAAGIVLGLVFMNIIRIKFTIIHNKRFLSFA